MASACRDTTVALIAGGAALGVYFIYHQRKPRAKRRLVLVTNYEYVANGRDYATEDLYLQKALRRRGFSVSTVHPNDLTEADFRASDHVVFRNTGPVTTHAAALAKWKRFQADGRDCGKLASNLQLKGDLKGKTHLLELTRAGGYPIIEAQLVGQFLRSFRHDGEAQSATASAIGEGPYMLKPLDGADSVGLQEVADRAALERIAAADSEIRERYIVQRLVAFAYEVSFYFVGSRMVYALRSGGVGARWEMQTYTRENNPGTWDADVEFARRLHAWNGVSASVVRVDGGREVSSGRLLLMEIEDYNPYLSLDLLEEAEREAFVDVLAESIRGGGVCARRPRHS